jgi:hypothetical protein
MYGLDSSGPGQRKIKDFYKYGNESSGSIKFGEFLD